MIFGNICIIGCIWYAWYVLVKCIYLLIYLAVWEYRLIVVLLDRYGIYVSWWLDWHCVIDLVVDWVRCK